MEYLILIFLLGVMTPVQTAANSRLRLSVGTPLVASLVSFAVGTLFLASATLIERGTVMFAGTMFQTLPWWAWLGGLCGLYGLTVNIIIFPKLGSVQTALMPMLGQIVMGMLIDNFGWLGAARHVFALHRLLALLLILVGVVMVVYRGKSSVDRAPRSTKAALPYQILGFSGGAVFAMQPSMNSLLSTGLSSSIHAAFISFLTATILLCAIVMAMKEHRLHIPTIFTLKDKPWWAWLGGIIGGTFVTAFAFFASRVGIGLLLVTSICGMLAMSLVIDKYGVLGATKKRIGFMQYLGLASVMAGIMILRLVA